MKKAILTLIAAIINSFTFGVIGLITLMNYGGNHCDQPPAGTCDCFCCDMFGLRGYEACGQFGLIAGIGIGLVTWYSISRLRSR